MHLRMTRSALHGWTRLHVCGRKGVSGSRGFAACLVHSFPTPGILGQFYCVVSLMRRVIKRHASSVPRELYDFVVVGGLVRSAARPAGAILSAAPARQLFWELRHS